jgi:hypothetical protein
MHEYALNFYRECGKRQKKKKSKLSLKPNIAGGLTPAGWAVRYEFKMAVFAEIIQDFDLATKYIICIAFISRLNPAYCRYYITVYNSLIELFAEQAPSGDPSSCSGKSTLKLQPFSRRWQEAVALADSLSYKISKFLLFSESPVNSLLQLNRHINLFYEIRRSIAVQSLNSFEYWGWSAQQYRLFGDVLSMAIGQGVRLPGPDILSAASADMNYLIAKSRISRIFGSSLTMTAAGTAETAVGGSSGKLSPPVGLVALLTPGFYYFMAAQCSANQSSVLKAMEAHSVVDDGGLEAILVREQLQPADRQSAWSECNQRTIDLCTGAYEQFKRHQNHRMALRAAMRIADTYLTVGNAEMAIKYGILFFNCKTLFEFDRFYEKISRSYRKEHQLELLHPVLVKILSCAQKLSDQQTQLRTLADLLSISHYATLISSNAELIEWHAQLRQLINAYQPNTGVSVLRLQTVRPLVSVECRFDQRRAFVDQPVILIVSLQSRIPALTNFHLHGLRVHLAVGQDMLMIRHQPSKISDHQVSKVENRIYSADLTLSADAPLELCVPVQFDCPKEIKVLPICSSIKQTC